MGQLNAETYTRMAHLTTPPAERTALKRSRRLAALVGKTAPLVESVSVVEVFAAAVVPLGSGSTRRRISRSCFRIDHKTGTHNASHAQSQSRIRIEYVMYGNTSTVLRLLYLRRSSRARDRDYKQIRRLLGREDILRSTSTRTKGRFKKHWSTSM